VRTYVTDSLSPGTLAAVAARCLELGFSSSLESVYWLPVAEAHHTPVQREHRESCGPYAMALTFEEDSIALELLVRSRSALHCNCIGYASPALREHMMQYVDDLIDSLSTH